MNSRLWQRPQTGKNDAVMLLLADPAQSWRFGCSVGIYNSDPAFVLSLKLTLVVGEDELMLTLGGFFISLFLYFC